MLEPSTLFFTLLATRGRFFLLAHKASVYSFTCLEAVTISHCRLIGAEESYQWRWGWKKHNGAIMFYFPLFIRTKTVVLKCCLNLCRYSQYFKIFGILACYILLHCSINNLKLWDICIRFQIVYFFFYRTSLLSSFLLSYKVRYIFCVNCSFCSMK